MILNYILVGNLLLALVLAIIGAILNKSWTDSHIETHRYIFE